MCACVRRLTQLIDKVCMLRCYPPPLRASPVHVLRRIDASVLAKQRVGTVQTSRFCQESSRCRRGARWRGEVISTMNSAVASTKSTHGLRPQVVVVTTVGCQFCKRAKDTLRQEQIQYDEIEAGSQPELLSQIKATTGRATVPQVCVTAVCSFLKNR